MRLFSLLLSLCLLLPPGWTDPQQAPLPADDEVRLYPQDRLGLVHTPTIGINGEMHGGACPVGPYKAYAARHTVVDDNDRILPGLILLTPTVDGKKPLIYSISVSKEWKGTDLVEIALDPDAPGFPQWFKIAKSLPDSGEPVFTVFTLPDSFEGRTGLGYTGLPGNHLGLIEGLAYSRSPISSGSSGSCMLNEKGEAFAVASQIRSFGPEGSNIIHNVSLGVPIIKSLLK